VKTLLARLRTGELSAVDCVAAHLDGLRRVDGQTNAVASFEDERALADAQELDDALASTGPVGQLHGLPITVKDWIDVEGFLCEGEEARHTGRRPEQDATVVARLRAAGAVVVAKTRPWTQAGPRVIHPLDPARSVGGSSSGEAVVVATGASPLGIGSDSGGSVRLPAAWCGTFGLKSSAGLVPTTGHYPRVGALSDGRTQIGPLAQSVDLLEVALDVMAGPDWRDAGVVPVTPRPPVDAELDLGATRFAVVDGGGLVQPGVASAVDRAASVLEAAGATRVPWIDGWLEDGLDITQRYWRRTSLTGADAELQLWDWDRYRRRYLTAAEGVDLLLSPAAKETAPVDREITGEDFLFTLPASLTGSPAVVVPAGRDDAGMPLSVQVIGRPWEDHRVLAAARRLEPPSREAP
jgi:amidase